jgi:nicotinamidase-related amidase
MDNPAILQAPPRSKTGLKMATISVPVRYYHQPRTAYVTEADFRLKTLEWDLDVSQIALILVDVWSDHYVSTHLERGGEITRERISPLMDAFRKMNAAVIHAPSPACAKRYPQWTQFAGDDEVQGRSGTGRDAWPPSEFRAKSGDYEKFARPKEPHHQLFHDIIANRDIIPEARPAEGDHVIVTGDQLHRVLKHKKILQLFYAGFAANMCIPFRDYGMRAMKDRGYDTILVRDCTSAIEVEDTFENFDLTRNAIIDTELTVGYSTTSADLISASKSSE